MFWHAKLLTMPSCAVQVKLHQPSRSSTFSSPRLPRAEEETASSNTYSIAGFHPDADGLNKQTNMDSRFWLVVWSTTLPCPSHTLEYLYQLSRMLGLSAGSLLCWQHHRITSSECLGDYFEIKYYRVTPTTPQSQLKFAFHYRLGDYFEIKLYRVTLTTPQSQLKFAFHYRPSSNASLRAEMDETT